MQVATLIQRASDVAGSQRALANAIEVSDQRLSDWKRGARPCPIEKQVVLCGAARLTEDEAMRHIFSVAKALAEEKEPAAKLLCFAANRPLESF